MGSFSDSRNSHHTVVSENPYEYLYKPYRAVLSESAINSGDNPANFLLVYSNAITQHQT